MSGGHFNYADRHMVDVANSIDDLVEEKEYPDLIIVDILYGLKTGRFLGLNLNRFNISTG